MTKFALVGHYNDVYQEFIGEQFLDHRREEIVALFTSKEKAQEYVEKSRLKTPQRKTFYGGNLFKRKSLLSGCEGYHIEEFHKQEYEIDPILI